MCLFQDKFQLIWVRNIITREYIRFLWQQRVCSRQPNGLKTLPLCTPHKSIIPLNGCSFSLHYVPLQVTVPWEEQNILKLTQYTFSPSRGFSYSVKQRKNNQIYISGRHIFIHIFREYLPPRAGQWFTMEELTEISQILNNPDNINFLT